MDIRKIYIALVLLLCVFLPDYSSGQSGQYIKKVDKSTLFYLFKNKGYEHLNVKMSGFQKDYEENYLAEDNLFDAFEVFSKADPAFEPLLNEWVKKTPESFVPFVSRAKYYCASAWQIQGRKRTIERFGKAFEEMERLFSLASDDVANALKINDKIDVCYAIRIEIGMALGNEELINTSLSEALSRHPYAYGVRLQYLQAITPRWGGSYQKMKEFIDGCGTPAGTNPRLNELAASIPADKGRVYAFMGKYELAEKMFTEALKYSAFHKYYAERGDVYEQMRNHKSAMADYEEALKLSPNDPDYLEKKRSALAGINSVSRFLKMNDRNYKPGTDNSRDQDLSLVKERQLAIENMKKGSLSFRSGKYSEAIGFYSEAIRLAPSEGDPYYSRALCYQRINDADAALQDLLRYSEIRPDDASAYFRITQIYSDRGMYDEALNAINKVIALDATMGEAFFYRSRIYERQGNNVEAIQDMRQSCDLGYKPACTTYMMK